MNILVLDTATEYCSVALTVNEKTFAIALHCKNQHAAKLLSMIDDVLTQAHIKLKDLDAIAFGQGPGSFTGVRIAISVAQGLAFGIQKPVIPISTLQIMAQQAYQQYGVTHARVALDARMQQVYYGYYILDDKKLMQLYGAESLIFPNELLISDGVGVGNGWQVYAINTEKVEAIYPDIMPIASAAIPLIIAAFKQGLAIDPAQALPVYLRDNVAQVKTP